MNNPQTPAPGRPNVLKETLRQHLTQNHSDGDLKRWYDPLRIEMCEDGKCLCVHFPHSFFAEWFARSVQDRFEEQLHLFLGPGHTVRYMNSIPGLLGGDDGRGAGASDKTIDFPFGHQFTFENFLSNKKNYFPLATAKEVAKNPEVIFNPFIICGGPGSGKTHLLKSIANEISKRHSQDTVFYGNIEDLFNIYQVTFKNDAFAARNHLCRFKYLLVDEFNLLKRYKQFQTELINLFNFFYDNKQQMIFSCPDRLPSYDFLDPKLKSRLEWGLIVNLKEPDLDIRIRYIERQCKAKKLPLTKEQVLTLAQTFADLRFLQGILLKFYAFKEFVHKDVTDRDFQQILSQSATPPVQNVTPEAVIDTVARHFEVEVRDVTGTKRHHRIVRARQLAMFLIRELMGSSFPALGRLFGNRDHSTALYAVKKIGQLQKDNPEVKKLVTILKKKCQAGAETP